MPPEHAILSEIQRQRTRRLTLLEALDEKNLAKAKANQALLRRRKSYVLKNNGKGRPAKAPKRPSQEDEARRLQYVTEIRLLDEILGDRTGLLTLDWLKAALGQESAVDAAARLRRRKIEQLISQFSDKPVDLHTRRPWSEKEVRAFLSVARERQMARLSWLGQRPLRTLADQDHHDREQAHQAVLDRLLASHKLADGYDFLTLINFLKTDVTAPAGIHDAQAFPQIWRRAVDEIVRRLRRRFEL